MSTPIDRKAVELLLSVLESPGARISGSLLSDYHPKQRVQLLAANLLKSCGYTPVTASLADHDDEPVSLIWSAEHDGYGYFSPSAGWITVPHERLAVFSVNYPALLAQMMVQFDLASRGGATALVPDVLWEIGDARIGRRKARTSIWFARRLYDSAIRRQIVDAAARRPVTQVRILLTTTTAARLPDQPIPGHLIVPVRDVFDFGAGLAIRPDILTARLDGTSHIDVKERLYLSPDGRKLIIDGNVTINFKSEIHIAIIRMLVDGFKKHKRFSARELLDHAHSGADSPRTAFGNKKWKELEPYLTSVDGLWGFEL
ncbi:hypothetical protein KUG47_15225 [Falsochrobactrum sp. TDYN1]|uniref:Uncharacterized protein n=1 Tax=Falsochrobactrum tianjinense TaxID=2706015 RepID=A0A949PR43_9HYPH|nr:hypothetical protein [Falsochrobactrum sp. TDYN1]MBV2144850.1 hypothetical protein [Falsochrobactrum sp. TDYN1]